MNRLKEYELAAANSLSRPAILALLEENALPVADLDESKALFACMQGEKIIGTGGLEFFKDCALLRSVAVAKERRGQGIGNFIVDGLESIARETGVAGLYLLTATAKDFFARRAYSSIDRDQVPAEIRKTREFSILCPSSAVVMRKFL